MSRDSASTCGVLLDQELRNSSKLNLPPGSACTFQSVGCHASRRLRRVDLAPLVSLQDLRGVQLGSILLLADAIDIKSITRLQTVGFCSCYVLLQAPNQSEDFGSISSTTYLWYFHHRSSSNASSQVNPRLPISITELTSSKDPSSLRPTTINTRRSRATA